MSPSPIGRKKIAHRFIGGYWCENRKSPVRDGRARLCRQHFLSPLRGSDLLPPRPTVETVGYFRSSLTGLCNLPAKRETCLRLNGVLELDD